ncbi:MAG: MBL fold metallo-hydrolase [Gemmatimonadaceae bacterium]
MNVASFIVGAFEENTWLLHDAATGEAVFIDPGDDARGLGLELERRGARLTAIWLTHAHLDHIGAVQGLRRLWPGVPVHLHPDDRVVYENASRAAAIYGIPFEQPEPAEAALAEGQVLTFAGRQFTVWHLPGHAPGHVAFVSAGEVFSGDLLFAGSIGRSDLPLSDPRALQGSLERLATLPPETVVRPGHGPATTIGAEVRTNPFLNGAARVLARRP